MLSHWNTTYNSDTASSYDKIGEKSRIPKWLKNNYHDYHRSSYKSEYTQSFGVHGDNPREKFILENGKLFNDNRCLAEGTSKASTYIPGYAGHIPLNETRKKESLNDEAYFRFAKTNHLLNYNLKIPHYQGHVPLNPANFKGNERPYCLSTREETFS